MPGQVVDKVKDGRREHEADQDCSRSEIDLATWGPIRVGGLTISGRRGYITQTISSSSLPRQSKCSVHIHLTLPSSLQASSQSLSQRAGMFSKQTTALLSILISSSMTMTTIVLSSP